MDVCLVSMPYNTLSTPSIGMNLLVSCLEKDGISVEAMFPSFDFAEIIGLNQYLFMSTFLDAADLAGEYTFTEAAFYDSKNYSDNYIQEILLENPEKLKALNDLLKKQKIDNDFISILKDIKKKVKNFIEYTADKIISLNPKIVGCSSMFQQHCASLALLRRIKEKSPNIVTLLGGANCEGELGYYTLKNCKWIDIVVSGEADNIFSDLCKTIINNPSRIIQDNLPFGAICREFIIKYEKKKTQFPINKVNNFKEVLIPNYDYYFKYLNNFKYKDYISPQIVVESSRGCWWGEISNRKCKFCSLNSNNASYRVKSPQKMLNELKYLSNKYGVKSFFFSDTILALNYFSDFLPYLAEYDYKDKYSISIETKANLNEEQIITMSKSGVDWFQPGIENLSDDLLNILSKGTNSIVNILLLRNSTEYNIKAAWNFLIDIPGEKDEWYSEMSDWIPMIFHLQPPMSIIKIRYDKFSEFYNNYKNYNLELEKSPAYKYIYPFDNEDLNGVARYFINKNNNFNNIGIGKKKLLNTIKEWIKSYHSYDRAKLRMKYEENYIEIIDTRPCRVNSRILLEGYHKFIYDICRNPNSINKIQQELINKFNIELQLTYIENILYDLIKMKILIEFNNKFLSLAIK